MSRFDFQGRTLLDREITFSGLGLPEADPSAPADGVALGFPVRPGGVAYAPYILVLGDFTGGTSPEAVLSLYLYFDEGYDLNSMWQMIRRGEVVDSVASGPTYLLLPTLGASRFEVKVYSASGSPTKLALHVRAISNEQAVMLGVEN